MKNLYKNSFEEIKTSNNFENRIIDYCENYDLRNQKKSYGSSIKKPIAFACAAVLTASCVGMTVNAASSDKLSEQVQAFFGISKNTSENINENASDDNTKAENTDYQILEKYMHPMNESFQGNNARIDLNGYVSDGSSVYIFCSITANDENFVFTDDMNVTYNFDYDSDNNKNDNSVASYGYKLSIDEEHKNVANFVIDLESNGKMDYSKCNVNTVSVDDSTTVGTMNHVLNIWHEFKDLSFASDYNPLKLTDDGESIRLYDGKKTDFYKEYKDISLTPFGFKYEITKSEALAEYLETDYDYEFENTSMSISNNLVAVMKDGTRHKISCGINENVSINYIPCVIDLENIDYIEHNDDVNGEIIFDVKGKYAEQFGTEETSENNTENTSNSSEILDDYVARLDKIYKGIDGTVKLNGYVSDNKTVIVFGTITAYDTEKKLDGDYETFIEWNNRDKGYFKNNKDKTYSEGISMKLIEYDETSPNSRDFTVTFEKSYAQDKADGFTGFNLKYLGDKETVDKTSNSADKILNLEIEVEDLNFTNDTENVELINGEENAIHIVKNLENGNKFGANIYNLKITPIGLSFECVESYREDVEFNDVTKIIMRDGTEIDNVIYSEDGSYKVIDINNIEYIQIANQKIDIKK